MEFITAEQFQEQDKDVQKVFINWWTPQIGDLFTWVKIKEGAKSNLRKMECCNSENIVEMTKYFKGIEEGERIPLLTEGQLRKFIENKAKCKVMIEYTVCGNIVIKICIEDEVTGSLRWKRKISVPNNKFDLVNSYWKVACMIAKEEVDE